MSVLSVFLRTHGLASVADAFKGLEDRVVGSVATLPTPAGVETMAVDAVGEKVKAVVLGAIDKVAPGADSVAQEVAQPLFAALEATALHFLEGFTHTTPPA